ncbi:MAG: alanine dehydrogenase [Elusimicrobiota bacterium]
MKIGSQILWLSESDVASLLSMDEAIGAMEKAFRLHGEGKVQLPAKIYLEFKPWDGDLRAMPAYVQGDTPSAGVKIVNSTPSNPEKGLPAVAGIMVYVDPQTGLPLSVMGAGVLTGIRTGAAGGVAAKLLAKSDSTSVGLLGCGKQARTQLEAIEHFFKIKKVFVWGKTTQESEDFCEKIKGTTQAELVTCENPREACDADILVTTTPVRTPVVKESWVKPGTHINAIGADAPGKQELETSLVLKSKVIVDEWVQASHAGEMNVPVEKGQFTLKNLTGQLGEILIGKKSGRLSPSDITIFDSTGLALQDVAVARIVYEKAIKQKKGQVLELYG